MLGGEQMIDDMSRMALASAEALLHGRKKQIWRIFKEAGRPLTARHVLDILNTRDGVRFREMNFVRPRITELVSDGFLVKLRCPAIDRVTKKQVRCFQYRPQYEQLSFA